MCEKEQHQRIRAIRDYLKKHYKFPDDQIDSMMPSFLATLARHMDALDNAMSERNPAQVGKAAHTIKGALLNLGLLDCAELAERIEQRGKQGQSKNNLLPLIAELRLKISEVLGQ